MASNRTNALPPIEQFDPLLTMPELPSFSDIPMSDYSSSFDDFVAVPEAEKVADDVNDFANSVDQAVMAGNGTELQSKKLEVENQRLRNQVLEAENASLRARLLQLEQMQIGNQNHTKSNMTGLPPPSPHVNWQFPQLWQPWEPQPLDLSWTPDLEYNGQGPNASSGLAARPSPPIQDAVELGSHTSDPLDGLSSIAEANKRNVGLPGSRYLPRSPTPPFDPLPTSGARASHSPIPAPKDPRAISMPSTKLTRSTIFSRKAACGNCRARKVRCKPAAGDLSGRCESCILNGLHCETRNWERGEKRKEMLAKFPPRPFHKQASYVPPPSPSLAQQSPAKLLEQPNSKETTSDSPDDKKRKKNGQRKSRLPVAAVQVLDDWFQANRVNPYPTEYQRAKLIQDSRLSRKQVDTWLGNARRRQLDPAGELSPLEFYLSGSSEDEAASIDDITRESQKYPFTTSNVYLSSPFNFPSHNASNDNMSQAGSMSSAGSAFDTYPEAFRFGPPKQGRKRYAYGGFSRSGSISSAASGHSGAASVNLAEYSPPGSSFQIPKLPTPNLWYICAECKARFKTEEERFAHTRLWGHKAFACSHCSKRFTKFRELHTHRVSYNHYIDPANPEVGESASTSPKFRSAKLRPHVCATCQRSFARLEHLKRHERTHAKEKPFQCPDCTRCFARKDLMLRHQQKLHHNGGTILRPSRRLSSTSDGQPQGGANLIQLEADEELGDAKGYMSDQAALLKDFTLPPIAQATEIEMKDALMPDLGLSAPKSPESSGPVQQRSESSPAVQFQCTFCHVDLSFKAWKRHEETQHLVKKQWTCMPHGSSIVRVAGLNQCAFCKEVIFGYKKEDHKCTRRVEDCLKRPHDTRTFNRRDKLAAHVKAFHGVALDEPVLGLWRADGALEERKWECGFCEEVLDGWDVRATHIAGHFRAGKRMSEWRTPRCPEVEDKGPGVFLDKMIEAGTGSALRVPCVEVLSGVA